MARLIFLEVLDGHGQTRSRMRVDALPATVGRGYDNDVILDDPYVCPTHARIILGTEGTLVVEDLGSVNGIHASAHNGRHARLTLRHGDTFRLGRTVMRVCESGQTLAPTLVDREPDGGRLIRRFTTPVCLAIVGGSFAMLALETFLASWERVGLAKVVSDALPGLVVFALWGGAWALVGRILSHRFNYLQHVAIALAVLALGQLVTIGIEWLTFFFPPGDAFEAMSVVGWLLLAAVLLYGHLTFASTLSRRMRWRTAFGVAGAIFAIVAFTAIADEEDYEGGLDFPSVLKPVPPGLLPSVTLDEFAASTARLKAEVDSLAAE